jgi:hypothetical protein
VFRVRYELNLYICYVEESRPPLFCRASPAQPFSDPSPRDSEKYRPDFLSEREPHINKPETVKKNNQRENGNNWSRFPGGCLIPRRTGQ